eukprot:scaffold25400_cov73-Phaeocystis_antarctica.AAC.2
MSTRNVPAGRWRKRSKASTQFPMPRYRTRLSWSALPRQRYRVPRHPAKHEHTQRSSGAMEEMSQKVQNASSHPKILRTQGT